MINQLKERVVFYANQIMELKIENDKLVNIIDKMVITNY